MLRHILGFSQSHAAGLQHRFIGYSVAFAKALNFTNGGPRLAFFNIREPAAADPIPLIVSSDCRLTGEALDRDAREVKFFPKPSKPIPRTRHDCHSGRKADSALQVCPC